MKLGPLDENAEVQDGPGLLMGITVYHLRLLCESDWNGGCGYSPDQAAEMTLDQIFFRLCDKDMLKFDLGKREAKVKSEGVGSVIKTDSKGRVRAKTEDGKTILLKTKGKSKARMLREAAEKKARKAKKQRK